MCSHLAAFKTSYLLKLDFCRHLASLPLGFHTRNSTGRLRKIVDENIEKLESFIAHQLPDTAGAMAAPLIILIILLYFDWRLGLACLLALFCALPLSLGIIAVSRKFQTGYGKSTLRPSCAFPIRCRSIWRV